MLAGHDTIAAGMHMCMYVLGGIFVYRHTQFYCCMQLVIYSASVQRIDKNIYDY